MLTLVCCICFVVSWDKNNIQTCHPPTCNMVPSCGDCLCCVELGEKNRGLATIGHRSQAMCTLYPGDGARYIKHTDNSCNTATGDHVGEGDRCNGRRLTSILYLNEDWVECDGGQLRIFQAENPDEVITDVEPQLGNLLLFWADRRVPHEVMPAFKDRYAITVWYFDGPEKERARLQGCSADEEDIQKERAHREGDRRI